MTLCDLHCHTTFSDGQNTPEQMVLAAMEKGMVRLGFSDHSSSPLYGMTPETEEAYIAEITRLKQTYRDRIEILCGIEQEYLQGKPKHRYDYVIGSVHYIRTADVCYPIDMNETNFLKMVNEGFGGDFYAMAEAYFAAASDVVRATGASIIGHFDLITKYNQDGRLFDESHPRYRAAWQAAVDALLPFGVPFEINTGAISRGYRQEPYPAGEILAYIKAKGGRLLLSSDSHSAQNLCFAFDRFEHLLH